MITAEKAHSLTKDSRLIMILNACENEIDNQIRIGSYEAVVYVNLDFPCEILDKCLETLRDLGYDVTLKGTLGLVFSEGQYHESKTEIHIHW